MKDSKSNPKNDASLFLGELFPEVPDKSKVLVWELSSKTSRWFSSTDTAATYATGRNDVYVGCALSPDPDKLPAQFSKDGKRKPRSAVRCFADNTFAIGGFWIDIDYKHAVHKKKNLPSTVEAAIKLSKSLLQPTVIMHTGHGIQAWWLFKELWVFDSDEERSKAANHNLLWRKAFEKIAKKNKWEVDATHDLARVFRIPDTINAKCRKQVTVKIIESDWKQRYNWSDFESYFPVGDLQFEKKKATPPTVTKGFLDLEVRPARGPNPQKWYALQSVDSRIKDTFEHKRKDLNDTSPSGYDMALACFAAQAGWSDQEIADLLVAHRIKHNPTDPKIYRLDYLSRTIARAKENIEQEEAQCRIEDAVDFGIVEGIEPGDIEGMKRALVKDLAFQLKVPMTRIVKYMTDPPQYRIETSTHHVNLGTVENLIEQRKFKNAIASITGRLITPIDSKRWPKTAQALLKACFEMDAGMGATDKGSVWLWLNQFCDEMKPLDNDEKKEALASFFPFFWEHRGTKMVCIFPREFSSWLKRSHDERMNSRKLGVLLRGFGGEHKPVKIDGKAHWVWVFEWAHVQTIDGVDDDEKSRVS